jgi:hypothetical protein
MTSMSARLVSRKLAAIGILLIIAAIGWFLLVWPMVQSHRLNSEAILFERERLGRLIAHDTMRADPGLLEKRLNDRTESGLFLEGDTDALKTARLQERITSFLSERNITVRATRGMNGTPIADFRRLGIEVELTLRLEELRALLIEISRQSPQLIVSSLILEATAPEDPQNRDRVDVKLAILGPVRDSAQ